MNSQEIEERRQRYVETLQPLFLPADPVGNDIVKYFASLLRIVGMEDKGWDPYLESRAILQDLDSLLRAGLPAEKFPAIELTRWRVGLLMYSHIVEMSAPYEVLTNLLRFQLGKGYSPNPYFMFLNKNQRERARRSGLYPRQKITIIKALSNDAGFAAVGDLFDEFYDGALRNAISHSDYIIADKEFRVRRGPGAHDAYSVPLTKVDELITRCQIFTSAFLSLDHAARGFWGERKGKSIPYDPIYKGLMEILVDGEGLMCGFKVHWPNDSESTYRRTPDRIQMDNCMLDLKNSGIEFFVGSYAKDRGSFSPLVEKEGVPIYTKIEGTGEVPRWP